jgi:hypothetical protein
MENLICVYRTDNEMRANLIKSHLESSGIMVSIFSNNASGMLPHLSAINPIEIMIKEEDKDKAITIISNLK